MFRRPCMTLVTGACCPLLTLLTLLWTEQPSLCKLGLVCGTLPADHMCAASVRAEVKHVELDAFLYPHSAVNIQKVQAAAPQVCTVVSMSVGISGIIPACNPTWHCC